MRWDQQQTDLKQTGRTTRMIRQAVLAAAESHVLLICLNDGQVWRYRALLEERGVGTRHLIVIRSIANTELDLRYMRVNGFPKGVRVFVDHAVIESELRLALTELHRYDS